MANQVSGRGGAGADLDSLLGDLLFHQRQFLRKEVFLPLDGGRQRSGGNRGAWGQGFEILPTEPREFGLIAELREQAR